MKRIFIVEDDISICRELQELLANAGYEAKWQENFQNIQKEILDYHGDLLLLDINIPEMNGEQLLKELRRETDIPIIMVTSRTSELDEVLSMSYGADDYITKPYNPTILLLRIAAVLKRTEQSGTSLCYDDIHVKPEKGILEKAGEEFVLTKNEMIIFMLLLQHRGEIVTRDHLMTELWDNSEYINDNALTVNISRLRSKLELFGYPDRIQTRKKQGYLLV